MHQRRNMTSFSSLSLCCVQDVSACESSKCLHGFHVVVSCPPLSCAYHALSGVSTSPGSVAADPADMSGGETEGDAFDREDESLEVAETASRQSISKRQEKVQRRQLQQKKARTASAATRWAQLANRAAEWAAERSRAEKLAAERKATEQPASLPNRPRGRQAGAAAEVSCCRFPGCRVGGEAD